MKKFLLALCAIVGISMGVSAQSPQLQIGYGGFTQMDCCDMHDGGSINNAWGALTAGLNFKIMPKFSVGLSYTFSSASFKHTDDATAYYHVIMFNGKYDYWRNSIVRLYAHGALGVDITHKTWHGESANKSYFAFQVSPIGAEVGLSRVATMFGEFGFGAQGLIQVGCRFNL